jgi:hypothetical protein
MLLEWIPYPHASGIMRRLEEVIEQGGSGIYLLAGPSNNGKTAVLDHLLRTLPVLADRSADRTRIPILALHAPPRPTLGRFLQSALEKTGALVFGTDRPAMIRYLGAVLERVGTRILAMDDAQNLLAGPRWEQQEFCSGLRQLAERARVSLLLVSTLEIFQWEPPLLPGAHILPLPAWKLDDGFREMIGVVENRVSRGRSWRTAADAATLHRLTEGRLGELISLLTTLSMTSADGKTGGEGKVLAQWIPPSERLERVGDVL